VNVTFADSVLHLVRAGARIDSWGVSGASDPAESPSATEAGILVDAAATAALADEASERGLVDLDLAAQTAQDDDSVHEFEPGLGDLEAAVSLVSTGLATRVVLSGFKSWPGLLWRAYQLADTTGVLILPTVVRPGGKVDIVITRDHAANG
jgi:hypothetical protein